MSTPNTQLATIETADEIGFHSSAAFAGLQRAAKPFTLSTLVPSLYRAVVKDEQNPAALANVCIALDMAMRMRANPLMVMQNLYIIEGRPSWAAQFVIAAINSCGRFSPLRFDIVRADVKTEVVYHVTEWVDRQKRRAERRATITEMSCVAWARELSTGDRIDGPPVTMTMAVKEGWIAKDGSKWLTMPEVMIRYRAAAFFGRIYAPELLMGLPTADEVEDTERTAPAQSRPSPAARAPITVDLTAGDDATTYTLHDDAPGADSTPPAEPTPTPATPTVPPPTLLSGDALVEALLATGLIVPDLEAHLQADRANWTAIDEVRLRKLLETRTAAK